MGGGDLNMKKSWHPLLLKNQERVWLEEKKALEEKKKLDQLRKEKEEERQLQELQRMQEEQTGKKRQEKLEWMYTTPATGSNQNANDLEDYLLGKKRVDKALTADDNAKLGASHKNFIAVQNANTARDITAKIREDPLLAIKQQEQAAYQALMSNPLRLREMQERNGIKPKKDKKEKRKEKEERKRLKLERKHRRERDSRSLSPRDRRPSRSPHEPRRTRSPYERKWSRSPHEPRRTRSPYERKWSRSPHEPRRTRSPYEQRRSPSPYSRRSRSHDRDYNRSPRRDDYRGRPSRLFDQEPRRRSDSRSPMRNVRERGEDRYPGSSTYRHRSKSPGYENGKRSRSPSPRYNNDSRSKRYRMDPPPPPSSQPHTRPSNGTYSTGRVAKTPAEERAARLAAMTSNASDMQDERKKRLAELLAKEKEELAKEELERAKSAKSGGTGSFMSADYKKVYGGGGGLEDRIRRSRGTLVID